MKGLCMIMWYWCNFYSPLGNVYMGLVVGHAWNWLHTAWYVWSPQCLFWVVYLCGGSLYFHVWSLDFSMLWAAYHRSPGTCNSNKCHFTTKWLPAICIYVTLCYRFVTPFSFSCPAQQQNSQLQLWSVCRWENVRPQDIKYNIHLIILSSQCEPIITFKTAFFTVEPPSDLKFKILNENTVEMTWRHPTSQRDGYRIQVTSDTGGTSFQV